MLNIQMELLNLYIRKLIRFSLTFFLVTPAFAGVLPFFSPVYVTNLDNSFYVNTNIFLTNDLFTLKDLFNGIKTNDSHIKNGTNIALAILEQMWAIIVKNMVILAMFIKKKY